MDCSNVGLSRGRSVGAGGLLHLRFRAYARASDASLRNGYGDESRRTRQGVNGNRRLSVAIDFTV